MNSNPWKDPQRSETTPAASPAKGDAHPRVLGSWKEIAQFLGKGVRTVQRWERELNLPVHRPSVSLKGVVIAFPEELERWAQNRPFPHTEQVRTTSALIAERAKALRQKVERLNAQCLRVCLTVSQRKKTLA